MKARTKLACGLALLAAMLVSAEANAQWGRGWGGARDGMAPSGEAATTVVGATATGGMGKVGGAGDRPFRARLKGRVMSALLGRPNQ